ncbi:thiamine pyrophosphate-requiring protein [Acidianus sulfidivorans JP7]|uniref:2-oxoacid oxidoreductase (ferredoxin) n=1 Tax=Acidianus sulfidivorans JP7 TaxID=619593 RepID=A0A2U9ILG3_9CREN|nr:thiamine pyrophosphate-requiring protein [Acidianus sulfidivorans]AWR96853.1 thiamine pyrophosphate-requiring protein [Acidianus sulfidivorans JP7]
MEVGEYVLNVVRRFSDKVFIVSGTDYPAFIKAESFLKDPEFVVVPHEITAAGAAFGYSLSGKLGVLMVHTVPGTLNALGVIADAYTSRVPLLVIAGKSPYTSKGSNASRDLRIHWTQDANQEEIVKYVKWAYEVRDVSQVPFVISRAVQIALSEPQGPVYIAIPREISVANVEVREPRMAPYYPGAPNSYIEKAKEMILKASNPIILTWRSGRKEIWFNSLKNFADMAEIPVLNYVGERVNYPSSGKMAVDSYDLRLADLIIEVETEVPWIPKFQDVDAKVIRVDVEPSYSYIPYYDFECDLCIQSAVDDFFNRLKIKRKAEKDLLEEIEKQREEKIRRIEKLSNLKEIHPDYLSFEIGKLKWTVFNEYNLNQKYGGFDEYNSYFGDPAFGHLGWALGASVGYKMATGKDVVAVVGDGSFIFGVPTAFYYISKKYPVLTVIFDNKSWYAVEKAVNEVYPKEKIKDYPGADLDIEDLPRTIESIGGFYYYIERPDEVEEALRKGKEKVKQGIPTIIHAKVMKD